MYVDDFLCMLYASWFSESIFGLRTICVIWTSFLFSYNFQSFFTQTAFYAWTRLLCLNRLKTTIFLFSTDRSLEQINDWWSRCWFCHPFQRHSGFYTCVLFLYSSYVNFSLVFFANAFITIIIIIVIISHSYIVGLRIDECYGNVLSRNEIY